MFSMVAEFVDIGSLLVRACAIIELVEACIYRSPPEQGVNRTKLLSSHHHPCMVSRRGTQQVLPPLVKTNRTVVVVVAHPYSLAAGGSLDQFEGRTYAFEYHVHSA